MTVISLYPSNIWKCGHLWYQWYYLKVYPEICS